jgi:ABC-type glycerol-3-phosphate transport system substrate-binding protein
MKSERSKKCTKPSFSEDKRGISRRTYLAAAGGVVAVAVVGGAAYYLSQPTPTPTPTATPTPTPTPRPEVTLSLWDHFQWEIYSNTIDSLIESAKKEYPNIKIQRSTWDHDAFLVFYPTAMGGGIYPDLIITDVGEKWLGALANAGHVVNLKPYYDAGYFSRSGPVDEKSIRLMTALHPEDEWYGIPFGIAYYNCTIYNKDMFEKYGWEVPKTWDEMWTLMEEMKKKGLVAYPIGLASRGSWWLLMVSLWCIFAGGENELKALRGEIPWNSPIFIEATKEAIKMYNAGFFPENVGAVTRADSRAMLVNEKAAWVVTWNELFPSIVMNEEMGKLNFKASWFQVPPATKEGGRIPGQPGYPFSITTGSKHKDEAVMFLDYIFSEPNWGKWLFIGSFVPLQKKAMEQMRSGLAFEKWEGATEMKQRYPLYYDEWVRLMQTSLDYDAFVIYDFPPEVEEWENMHALDILNGTISVEDYLAYVQEKYSKYLAEQKRQLK